MKTMWVRAAVVGSLFALSVVFAPTVAAQKGAGNFPAGSYHFTSSSVDFSSFGGNMQVFLNVSANTDISRPEGGPQTTTSETEVFLNLFDYTSGSFTSACLLLDHPSDFVIDSRLNVATLATTLTPTTPSCPFSSPLTTTISINGTWTGNGPISTNHDESTYKCSRYSANSDNRSLSNLGTANLTVTVGGTSTVLSSTQIGLNSNDFRVEADGVAAPGCGPAGIGSGPIAAGKYHFFGLTANAFFGMPPGPTNQISLYENNQVASPAGGTATTSKEFDLNVSMFGGAFNGFGCWIMSPSDVTSTGTTSATIQTTITAQSQPCGKSFPGFGVNYPLTVNVKWVSNGPLITVRDENTFTCAGYTASTDSRVQSRSATSTATVTMPDYLGNPMTQSLAGGQGSLTYINQKIEADGVEQQACLIRG